MIVVYYKTQNENTEVRSKGRNSSHDIMYNKAHNVFILVYNKPWSCAIVLPRRKL